MDDPPSLGSTVIGICDNVVRSVGMLKRSLVCWADRCQPSC
jgi:hypothetical protein